MLKFAPALLLVTLYSCSEPPLAAPEVKLEATQVGEMKRLHVRGDYFLGSQPSEADLGLMQEAGLRTVVNLRKPQEMQFEEGTVVAELGMNYIHLPWGGPAELTDEVFDRGRAALSDGQKPLLLHCASSNRVGAIWLVWRVLDDGADLETATTEAQTAGMRTPQYLVLATDYIARQSGE